MPTYEYSCEKCGQNFDAFQSMRDEPFRECPKELCRLPEWGHGKVKRLLGTGAGLIFKGSGFYTTDYRSDSYKEAAKKESPAPSSGGEKSAKPKEPAKASSPAQTKTPEKEAGQRSWLMMSRRANGLAIAQYLDERWIALSSRRWHDDSPKAQIYQAAKPHLFGNALRITRPVPPLKNQPCRL